MKTILGLLIVLTIAGCDSGVQLFSNRPLGKADAQPALFVSFDMKIGEEVVVKGTDLHLYFEQVPDDSRCPVSVQCVWAGSARLLLRAWTSDAGPIEIELQTFDPTPVPCFEYTVEVKALHPYPEVPGPIDPSEYVATLTVKP